MDLVSATYARNNLSRMLDEVIKKGKRFILIRDSQPQAAIVPYDDLLMKEKEWDAEFWRLATQIRSSFRTWIKRQKIKEKDLTEESLYGLINKAAGRS